MSYQLICAWFFHLWIAMLLYQCNILHYPPISKLTTHHDGWCHQCRIVSRTTSMYTKDNLFVFSQWPYCGANNHFLLNLAEPCDMTWFQIPKNLLKSLKYFFPNLILILSMLFHYWSFGQTFLGFNWDRVYAFTVGMCRRLWIRNRKIKVVGTNLFAEFIATELNHFRGRCWVNIFVSLFSMVAVHTLEEEDFLIVFEHWK